MQRNRIHKFGYYVKSLNHRPDIKRCPHCNTYYGSIEIWHSVFARWFEPKYNLYCTVCHWCGGKAYTKRGAIRVWNDDIERMRQNGEVNNG